MPTANAGKFTARFNGVYVIKYELDGVGYERQQRQRHLDPADQVHRRRSTGTTVRCR